MNKIFKHIVIGLLISLLLLNTKSYAKEKNEDIYISDVKFNTETATWDFTIKSDSKDYIYYTYKDNEYLLTYSNSRLKIKSNEVISIPSSMINSCYSNLKLCHYDKKGNIRDAKYFNVNKMTRNIYYTDLSKFILKLVNKNDSKYEQLKTCYRWIGETGLYEYNGLTNNEYNAFYSKTGACSGYARLFKDICEILGIKCEYVSEAIVDYKYVSWHAWNHVELDGKTYFVDPTWSGICFNNKVDYSHFCNNAVVKYVVTYKYDLSHTIDEIQR